MKICNYLLLLLVSRLTFVCGQKVYTIDEETGQDAYIGSIPQDLKLPLRSSSGSPLEYNILSGDDKIRVDRHSGDLHTIVNLDRETLCPNNPPKCTIDVEVLVTPLDPFKLFKVQLILKDLNDNTPAFPSDIIEKEISESAIVGSLIRLDSAVDPDFGLNSIQRYEITTLPPSRHDKNGKSVPYFRLETLENVDGTKIPQLILVEKLDRENISSYEFLLTAIDGGTPPSTGTATILISVTDANDNPPSFLQSSYVETVPEDAESGYSIIQLQASDLDSGPNARITYSFPSAVSKEDRSRFNLNEDTGVLSVSDVGLDYESKKIYHLTVEAKDQGSNPASTYATVTIKVQDVNDEAPHIDINFIGLVEQVDGGNAPADKNSKLVSIKENTKVGTYIAFLTITDRDTGMNGNVSCQLKESTSFKMVTVDKDENRYLIKTKVELDREVKRFHNMEIEAWDFGHPAHSSSMTVVVELLDENDNDPSFGKKTYRLAVSESVLGGADIAELKAQDIDDGVNAEISYSVKPDLNASIVPFAINPTSGYVYFIKGAKPLDAESRTEPFHLTVTATDNGVPPRNTSTTLIISIADENDNQPKFEQKSYVFRIKEDEKLGKYLGRVRATDKDVDKATNGKITYSFLSDVTAFTIKAETGEIFFNGQPEDLDREARHSKPYLLPVIATDHGEPPLTDQSTVDIYLIDVNDNHPTILFPNVTKDIAFLYIKPQLPSAAALAAPLKATDTTSGNKHPKLLRGVDDSENSTVNSLPSIYVTKPTKPALKDVLLIGSSSSKKTRTPRSVPVVIAKIKVDDLDEGENGRVRYTMVEGNTYNYFGVDMHTGNVTLRITDEKKLRQMKRGCHVIKINVDDLGKPSFRSPAWVNIYVTDASPGSVNVTEAMKGCTNNTFYPRKFVTDENEIIIAGLSLVIWIAIIAGCLVFLLFIFFIIVIKLRCCCCAKKSRTRSGKNPVDAYNDTAYTHGTHADSKKKKDHHRFPSGTIDSRTSYCSEWTASHMQMTRQDKGDMMMQGEVSDGSVRSARDSGTGDSMPSDAYHTTMAGSGVYRQPYPNQSFTRPPQPYGHLYHQPNRVYLPPQGDLTSTDEESRRYPPNTQMVFTSKCTNECRLHGHGDQCWMPDSLQRTPSHMTSFKGVDGEFDGDSLKYRKKAIAPNSYNPHQEQMRYTTAPSKGPFYYDSVSKFDNSQQREAMRTFRDENVESDGGSPVHSQVAMSDLRRQPSLNSGYRYPSHPSHGQVPQGSYGRSPVPFPAGLPNHYEAPSRGQAYVNLQGGGYESNGAMPEEVHSNLSSTSSGNQASAYQNSYGHPRHFYPQEQPYPNSYPSDFHSYGNQTTPASYDEYKHGGNHSYDDNFAATNLLLSPADSEPGDYKQRLERQMEQHQQQQSKPMSAPNYENPSESEAHQLLRKEPRDFDQQESQKPDKLSTIREELDADEVVAGIDGLLL